MIRARVWGWLSVALLCVCGGASAQAPKSTFVSRGPDGRPTVRAFRLDAPLHLDGRLDEPFYTAIAPYTEFVQQEPHEGQPASEKTEAWIAFDDENIYVSARLWDDHPERWVLNELRRDSSSLIQNEQLTVVLDTFHDRRNGMLFLVNALGGMLDEAFVDERNPSRDWNAVWDARTGRFDGGWTLEMAIPFKSLRYAPGVQQVWGINMNRFVRWKNERDYLSQVPASITTGAVVVNGSYHSGTAAVTVQSVSGTAAFYWVAAGT